MLFIPEQKRQAGMEWAQRMLASNAVILDTETTGLTGTAQAVQLSIVGVDGRTLYDSLLRPSVSIPDDIAELHGITNERVRTAPTILAQIATIKPLLIAAPVIIYNAKFDTRILAQSLKAFGLDTSWLADLDVHCAMLRYTDYRDSKRWLPLVGGNHEAVGDCLATLNVIRTMAKGD